MRPCGSELAGGDVVAAEVEEVVDPVVGREEPLRLAGRLEPLHLPFSPPRRLMGYADQFVTLCRHRGMWCRRSWLALDGTAASGVRERGRLPYLAQPSAPTNRSVQQGHFAKHLKALRWRTPFHAICDAWTIFKIDPHHLIPGP